MAGPWDTRPWWDRDQPVKRPRRKSVHSTQPPAPNGPVQGERHGRAKIIEAQVVELRRRYAAGGVTQRVLAEELGITPRAVALIVRGQRWRHVECPSLNYLRSGRSSRRVPETAQGTT